MAKFTKFGNVAGVLAPAYHNRTDLQKYDLALREGKNWFVDYQGGLSTRPGSEFHDFIEFDSDNIKIVPFQYAYSIEDTYLVIFGDNYIRFMQDGAYVLEAEKTVTSHAANVLTIAAHGYVNNEWVKVFGLGQTAGKIGVIENKTVNTFELTDIDGNPLTISGTGSIARIYTLVSSFGPNRLAAITTHQLGDTLRITSSERTFVPYNLKRTAHTNWSLTKTSFINSVPRPDNLSGDGDTTDGDSTVIFAVTAVDVDGEESLPSERLFITGIRNYANTTGYARIEWDPQNNIRYYNVYRSIIAKDGNMTAAQQLGFIGRAYGPTFTDNNIVPDFTVTPPLGLNPFANAGIDVINVTAPGAGYTQAAVVTIADPDGSGFEGFPIISKSGEVLAIAITNSGQDYTAPVVSVSTGAGATFSVELTPDDGNKPSVGCVFQQRQIYAGTTNHPLGLVGSKPGLYENFDVSNIIVANDSFSFDIDSPVMEPVKHLVPTKAGLLITTAAGLWQLSGSNGAVTAVDAAADRQAYIGVADVPPLEINEDIAILDSENKAVRLLAYSDYQRNYISNDVSILSNHYFTQKNKFESWAYFGSPHRLICGVRADGSIVTGCIVKEHEIYGWTNWSTQGYYLQLAKVREVARDRCYLLVERIVNGRRRKFLESFTVRDFVSVEDYVGLDAALTLAETYPTTSCTVSALSGEVVVETVANYFTGAMVGYRWRGGGGRGTVTAVASGTSATLLLDTDVTKVIPETETPAIIDEGDWTLDAPVSVVSGLDHLEGMTVSALLDGQVYHDFTVVGGEVDLGVEVTRAVIGLKFTCVGQTLPLSTPQAPIEFDRKHIVGVGMWQNQSRGLKVGTSLTKLYELPNRTNENYNELTQLHTGVTFASVEPVWEIEDKFYFVQEDPLPASLLGILTNAETGDDDDDRNS